MDPFCKALTRTDQGEPFKSNCIVMVYFFLYNNVKETKEKGTYKRYKVKEEQTDQLYKKGKKELVLAMIKPLF